MYRFQNHPPHHHQLTLHPNMSDRVRLLQMSLHWHMTGERHFRFLTGRDISPEPPSSVPPQLVRPSEIHTTRTRDTVSSAQSRGVKCVRGQLWEPWLVSGPKNKNKNKRFTHATSGVSFLKASVYTCCVKVPKEWQRRSRSFSLSPPPFFVLP